VYAANTAAEIAFKFPPVLIGGNEPLWNGTTFAIDGTVKSVLEYGVCDLGWNDGLTNFQEENAGTNHFIDKASRAYALTQIKNQVRTKAPVILEIGCSSGFMLKEIKQNNIHGTTIGVDIVREPLEKLASQLPGVPLLRFNLLHCPLPDQCVDAVVALNVLEHIERDDLALAQIYRILKPGGVLILEVPAGPELYDEYDNLLLHYRRYTLARLLRLLTGSGFQIECASHLGCFIYPGFWLVKQLSKLKKQNKPD
jgi:SAM-dependent methyltransferase